MAAKKTAPKKASAPKAPALPKSIKASDLKHPKHYKDLFQTEDYRDSFELWYSEGFGWCIPTLLIGRSRRAIQSYSGGERTYAVRVSDGGTVRIGNGPHIKSRVTVYLRKSRKAALQKFLDLMGKGAARAGQIRDRISTRRMRSSMSSWF